MAVVPLSGGFPPINRFLLDCAFDTASDCLMVSLSQQLPQWSAGFAKETGSELPGGRQAESITGGTEVVGHRRDDPEPLASSAVLVIHRRSRRLVLSGKPFPLILLRKTSKDFITGNKPFSIPYGFVKRHELDQTQNGTVFRSEVNQILNLTIVEPPDQDRVELEGDIGMVCQSIDATPHILQSADACHMVEPFGVQRVHADVDPRQAGLADLPDMWLNQGTVGCQHHLHPGQTIMEGLDKGEKALPDKGLSAGEPDLSDSHFPKNREERKQLLVAENLIVGDPWNALFRHTVPATEVTTIRNGDPHVVQLSTMGIYQLGHR